MIMVLFTSATLAVDGNRCENLCHLVVFVLLIFGRRQALYTSPRTVIPEDFFWKISFTDHPDGYILASDKSLTHLDWRVR
jgi:hypothetical protein